MKGTNVMAMKKPSTKAKTSPKAAKQAKEPAIIGHEKLVSLISERLTGTQPDIQVSKKNLSAILKATEEIILDTVEKGDKVRLLKFGTFEKKCTPERMGHNPSNGSPMKIPAKKKFQFRSHVEF